MYINPRLISEDKNKEGVYHKSDKGAIYMFFNQLKGENLRLDIFNNKKIADVEEFKNYNIISCSDKYNPKSKVTTYYLSPQKEYYNVHVDKEIKKTDILNLKNMYETHSTKRIVTLSVGKDKITHISKTGVVTPTGEYPYNVWEKLLLEQASKLNETYIIDKLKQYSLNLPWIKKEKEAYEKALALYSRRIFEDKKWVGFEGFKKELNTK